METAPEVWKAIRNTPIRRTHPSLISTTTIQLPRDVTQDLNKLKGPGQTYADVIIGLLYKAKKYDHLFQPGKARLGHPVQVRPTLSYLTKQTSFQVKKSSIEIQSNSILDFTYYGFTEDPEYTMNITITKVILDGNPASTEDLKKLMMQKEFDPLQIYLKIVEKIIQVEIDSRFRLPNKFEVYTEKFWENVFETRSIPHRSFQYDIKNKMASHRANPDNPSWLFF